MGNCLVYTGTFNPVTKAHEHFALEVMNHLNCHQLVVVPVNDSYSYKNNIEKAEHRYQMLQIAFHTRENVTISDYEMQKHGFAYTYDTLCAIQEEYPQDTIYYLIGDDNLLFLKVWYRMEDLLKQFRIVVVNRSRSKNENEAIIQQDELLMKYQKQILVLDNESLDLSSTLVRNALEQKDIEKAKDYVSEDVLQYIDEHQLYRK